MTEALISELLRGKILYVTFAGFLLLPFVSLGLFWLFEYSDRKRRFFGIVLLLVFVPLSVSLILFGLFG